jgi:hypothetical protein
VPKWLSGSDSSFKGKYPENSLLGFQRAVEAGATVIEAGMFSLIFLDIETC